MTPYYDVGDRRYGRRTAIQIPRGGFNMALNQRERQERQRRAGSFYVHFVVRVGADFTLVDDRAGLVRKGA